MLVLLVLDGMMMPNDVEEDTPPEDAPSLVTLTTASRFSDTWVGTSLARLWRRGFVCIEPGVQATGWTQTKLYGLTPEGRALLGRLFPSRPPR